MLCHTVETSLGPAKCLCCLQPLQLHLTQAWVYANLDTHVSGHLCKHTTHMLVMDATGQNQTWMIISMISDVRWWGVWMVYTAMVLKVNDQNQTGFWVTREVRRLQLSYSTYILSLYLGFAASHQIWSSGYRSAPLPASSLPTVCGRIAWELLSQTFRYQTLLSFMCRLFWQINKKKTLKHWVKMWNYVYF